MAQTGHDTAASRTSGRQDPPPRAGRSLLREAGSALVDLVVPVAGYYALRGLGAGQLLALVLASVPTAVFLVWQTVRRRHLDRLGVFVLAILAASVAVSFITGSPRFLLAKEGWFTGAIGVAFLVTLRFDRPLAFTLARSMLERTPLAATLRIATWDAQWDRDPRFRRIWRTCTVLWGCGLLLDAAIRVVMAYTLPVDTVPALAGALFGVTFVALQVAQHVYFERTGLWAGLRQGQPDEAGGPGASGPADSPAAAGPPDEDSPPAG